MRKEIEDATAQRAILSELLEAAEITDNPDSILTINSPETATNNAEVGTQPEDRRDAAASDNVGEWLKGVFEKAKANPGLLLYKLQTNAYKLSWLLIPLSLPFMWLLFPFSRRFKMYDHTVVVTYSIAFMTMLAWCCHSVLLTSSGR